MNIAEMLRAILDVPTDFKVFVKDEKMKAAKFVAIDVQKRQIIIFAEREEK